METGEFINGFLQDCCDVFDKETLQKIESRLYIALDGCEIVKQQTALSVDVEHNNEWYIGKFIAIKMINGCAKRTLDNYKITLQNFFKKCRKHVKLITTDDIRLYLAYRETKDGIAKTTQDNELRILRSFWQCMTTEEMLEKNVTKKIPKIRSPKKVKKPFSEYEIEQIRKAVIQHSGTHAEDKKHLAIIDVLASTGCRVSELVGMNRSDLKGNAIIVKGKGNKERYVYLNARAMMSLNEYLATRKDDKEAMFIGYYVVAERKGEYIPSERMDIASVGSFIRKAGRRVGIEKAHPHRFRRTAATLALRRGMPIEQVGKMLGHEQLSTTQIYAKSEESDIRLAHEKYLGY